MKKGAKKTYKCDKCDDKMDDNGYQGYCSSCYGDIWDAGFESTSQHAHEVTYYQLVDCLDQPCTKKTKEAMEEIMVEWGPLQWSCGKCKTSLLSLGKSSKTTIAKKVEILCEPCKKCGAPGNVRPKPPDKFYH